ncbi:hypothetical protein [Blastococcus sp. VKM Ac-2987]|uniref:hypothetical protein n=1 Tax=Blastococcus sp. VKM Ac-2987 TaxID=3004141 RepID=UPI0022AB6050|nr:hypothetical protein [Blastococcus sp. VKM Ac-2987]MCZ2857745.1 hypothetical protein [Blastococcus sp. VKM Ac-2987]
MYDLFLKSAGIGLTVRLRYMTDGVVRAVEGSVIHLEPELVAVRTGDGIEAISAGELLGFSMPGESEMPSLSANSAPVNSSFSTLRATGTTSPHATVDHNQRQRREPLPDSPDSEDDTGRDLWDTNPRSHSSSPSVPDPGEHTAGSADPQSAAEAQATAGLADPQSAAEAQATAGSADPQSAAEAQATTGARIDDPVAAAEPSALHAHEHPHRPGPDDHAENERVLPESGIPTLIHLVPAPPNFKLSGISIDDRAEIVKAMNRYRYAIKIGEPERCAQDVERLAWIAERENRPDILALAASLARVGGRADDALTLFEDAALQGDPDAEYGAAAMLFDEHDPIVASRYLAQYLGRAETTVPGPSWAALFAQFSIQSDVLPDNLLRELLPLIQQRALTPQESLMVNQILSRRDLGCGAHTPPNNSGPPGDLVSVKANTAAEVTTDTHRTRTPDRISGHVQRLDSTKGHGFLADGAGQLHYFEVQNLDDHQLQQALRSGWRGRVEFSSEKRITPAGAKRTVAYDLRPLEPLGNFGTKRANRSAARAAADVDVQKRSYAGGAAWGEAKRLERAGELNGAKQLYQLEISNKGPRRLSAIKDLAWLLNRLDEWKPALHLLEKHRNDFAGETRAVDNLRLSILLKGRQYPQAREVIALLYESSDRQRRMSLTKQDVFCLIAMDDIPAAKALLKQAIEEYPNDATLPQLLERTNSLSEGLAEADLQSLQSYVTGLSPFAVYALEGAQLVGADERSKARGYYDERDFQEVNDFLTRIRGRRPRERADVALTLAYMCWQNPQAAGDVQLSDLLRRYFSLMAESAAIGGADRDTVRAYATEALALAAPDKVLLDAPVLVSTYIGDTPENPVYRERLHELGARLEGNLAAWSAFLDDLAYYVTRSSNLQDVVRTEICNKRPTLQIRADFSATTQLERDRQVLESARLEDVKIIGELSLSRLQDIAGTLADVAKSARFALDRQRLLEINQIVGDMARYWGERDFTERVSSFSRAKAALDRLRDRMDQQPTALSVSWILAIVANLSERVQFAFEKYLSDAKPALTVENILADDQYRLDEDGTVTVALQLELAPGSPPIEDVEVGVSAGSGIALIKQTAVGDVMRAGTVREVRLQLRPSEEHVKDLAFTLDGVVTYSSSGSQGVEKPFSLAVRLNEERDFAKIDPNPYEPYSGGSVVADPHMFFGRRDLLEDILAQVTLGPTGQCFVLYGQKRSGKSSVLSQVSQRLSPPVVAVNVTLGEIDAESANRSFLRACIEELEVAARRHNFVEYVSWPTSDALKESPIEAFRRVLRSATEALGTLTGQPGRIVYLVDEFTYMYEYISEGLVDRSFMRQWKALLESRLFSAVIIGQDSMPRFKQEFPNEFGVTRDERISYLPREDALELAQRPIFLEGKSRYRGKSLDKIYRLTAGSPWFIQILCDELVRHLNHRRAPLITEFDIDSVVRTLVNGSAMLPIERFDPLITAAGESVGLAARQDYMAILAAIAAYSSPLTGAPRSDLSVVGLSGSADMDVLIEDMIEREILTRDHMNRLRIRVGLFEEWLRMNRPVTMAVS